MDNALLDALSSGPVYATTQTNPGTAGSDIVKIWQFCDGLYRLRHLTGPLKTRRPIIIDAGGLAVMDLKILDTQPEETPLCQACGHSLAVAP